MEQAPAGTPPETAQPVVEQQARPAGAERAVAAPPQATTPLAQPFALPIPPIQSALPPQTGVTGTTQPTAVPLADDGDLIEKEWVDKAKQIVEHTRDDPYKQSEELTVVKADYMKQRYNKAIKLNK